MTANVAGTYSPYNTITTAATTNVAGTYNCRLVTDDEFEKMLEETIIEDTINKAKEKKGEANEMNNNMFNGVFGKINSGVCRLSMSGKVAINTSNGYKEYDVETGRLTNCDNFVLDVGEDYFFVIPVNKVKRGDIILVSGKPRCVLEVGDNDIKTLCYEDNSISTIIPEYHFFIGKQYLYAKIVSVFGEMGTGRIMKFMIMKELMSGKDNGMGSIMPMMLFMSGKYGNDLFDGVFDFTDDEDSDS